MMMMIKATELHKARIPGKCALKAAIKSKNVKQRELEMWANAQRDGRPAEYRWRPQFNAAKFG